MIGGERVEAAPLTLENALKLALLLAPHAARVEEHWPEVRAALARTDGRRGDVLSSLFVGLRGELASAPGDMVRAMGLLLGRDPVWVAERVTARQFVDALATLDEVNDLVGLWEAVQALGITARYRNNGTA